eukprot:5909338-Prymnesium_polylepis.1
MKSPRTLSLSPLPCRRRFPAAQKLNHKNSRLGGERGLCGSLGRDDRVPGRPCGAHFEGVVAAAIAFVIVQLPGFPRLPGTP